MPDEAIEHRSPGRPLFGAVATAGIAVVLALPFATLTLADLEPYPAVIFPGGGEIAATLDGDVVTFYTETLIGVGLDGAETPIAAAELLDPIPPSHLTGIVGTEFGQDLSPSTSIHIRKTPLTFDVPRHVPSAEDRAAARRWLAERLSTLGLMTDSLRTRTERVRVDHATGDVLDREIVEEVELLD